MNETDIFTFKDLQTAISTQQHLSQLVKDETYPGFKPRLLCGLDAAYEDGWGVGAAAVWDLETSNILEVCHAEKETPTKYVPGLLGFREGPLLVAAIARLQSSPEVFLADGHGIAHPRRFGLACHVGLAVDKPTIGVAKSLLYGKVVARKILDADGTILGKVLKTKSGKGFYLSVGHKLGLDDAVRLVRRCLVDDQPAPLRRAHLEATRLRRILRR